MVLKILKKHPILTTLGVSLLFCGSAMAAFSITPASDSKQAMVVVSEIEKSLSLDQELGLQTSLLDEYQYLLYRDCYTRTTDTPETLFERLSINDPAALEFLQNDILARLILGANKKIRVVAKTTPDGRLVRMKAYFQSDEKKHFQRITIERDENDNLISVSHTIPAEVKERVASATIKHSLFGAAQKANLPNNIAYQFYDIFEGQIDFSRQVHPGDTLQLVYESYEADGEALGTGKILAAQFINAGRKYNAVWFEPEHETFRGSYFTFDGNSLRTTFLAYPLEYTRISSQFGRRLHPIQQTWKNHNGTDYAAPTGTPIRTVGDGRVKFAGTQSGYGKVVIVEHDKARTTLYAHMSAINVSTGQVVEQGDVIGKVGQTGWATGPHLHLEFHENGVRKDPAILATQRETQEMPKELISVFEKTAEANANLIGRVSELMLIDESKSKADL